VAASVAGQVDRGGLAGVEAGDGEGRYRGADLDRLVLAGVLRALADLAGDVPFDERSLPTCENSILICSGASMTWVVRRSRRPCPVPVTSCWTALMPGPGPHMVAGVALDRMM
jgi:hypothetical protein